MPLRYMFVLAATLVTSAVRIQVIASDAPPESQPVDRVQRELQPFHPRLVAGAFIALDVPEPITPHDVDRYASTLQLDAHQTQIVHVLFERYAERENALRWKELAPLFESSAQIAARKDMTSNPTTAEAYARIMKERETVIRHLSETDDSFFGEIELLLSDKQAPRLESVRQQRARDRFRAVACDYVGGRLEITRLIHELGLPDETLSENAAAKLLLDEYEYSLTRLWENHYKLKTRWMVEETLLMANAVSSNSIEMHQQRRDRSLAANEKIARAARKILDLNAKTVEDLASVLPSEMHKRLLDEFRRIAYPSVYPNPYVFDSVIQQSLEISSLAADQRAAILQIQIAHQAIEQTISKTMVDRYLARLDYFLVDKGVRMDRHEEYKKDMTELQLQRRLNAESAIREVKAQLSGAQAPEMQTAELSFQRTIDSHQAHESGFDFRP